MSLKKMIVGALLIASIFTLCSCGSSGPKKLEGVTVLMPLGAGYYDSEYKSLSNQLKDKGATIVVAGIDTNKVTGEEGTSVEVDKVFTDLKADDYDAVVVVGGLHYTQLNMSQELRDVVTNMNKDGKVIASICNGTRFVSTTGSLKGKDITCRPDESIISELSNSGAKVSAKYQVASDGNVVTAQGYEEDWNPFAKEIVKVLSQKSE